MFSLRVRRFRSQQAGFVSRHSAMGTRSIGHVAGESDRGRTAVPVHIGLVSPAPFCQLVHPLQTRWAELECLLVTTLASLSLSVRVCVCGCVLCPVSLESPPLRITLNYQ